MNNYNRNNSFSQRRPCNNPNCRSCRSRTQTNRMPTSTPSYTDRSLVYQRPNEFPGFSDVTANSEVVYYSGMNTSDPSTPYHPGSPVGQQPYFQGTSPAHISYSQENPAPHGEYGQDNSEGTVTSTSYSNKNKTAPASSTSAEPHTSPLQINHFHLSDENDSAEMAIGGIIYHLNHGADSLIEINIAPAKEPVLIDLKYSPGHTDQNSKHNFDNHLLTSNENVDGIICSNSNEIHRIWLRQQNPSTLLWSLYEINTFVSCSGTRITVWVYLIETNILYP